MGHQKHESEKKMINWTSKFKNFALLAFLRDSALQTRPYLPAGERRKAFDGGDRNPERWVFR